MESLETSIITYAMLLMNLFRQTFCFSVPTSMPHWAEEQKLFQEMYATFKFDASRYRDLGPANKPEMSHALAKMRG